MLLQRPRDLGCMRGESGAVDVPRPRQIDTELLANTPRMRREQNHPIAETDRFTNVVRYEHDRFLASCSGVMASSAANGSSINNTRGFGASARARATRCFMPPDSSWIFDFSFRSSPTSLM